ncbi:MAG: flavodoxin domain-containing protein [Dehalococcoidia bacterium]
MLNEKILVAYASRYGATEEIAHTIGRVLSERGAVVDVGAAGDITDLTPYTAVVVGAPVAGGRWLPEAQRFVAYHRATLERKPVALFAVSIDLREPAADRWGAVAAALEPARAQVRPVEMALFAGAIERARMPLLRWVAMKLRRRPDGDFRNWRLIQGWARDLQTALAPVSRS